VAVERDRVGGRNPTLAIVRWAVALALASLALPALAQAPKPAAPAPWPDRYYNPQPAADDLILPMPCGGAMAFRRIDVPHEKTLSDRKIVIGGSEERFAYAEGSRYEYIEGSFADRADARRRYYYLAKYETTVLQLDAMSGECKEATRAGLRPATGATWYDGMRAAHRYTEWLLKEAKAKLPREDGFPGFLRLPTEAEWEFAARGGVSVSSSQFEAKTFPMTDGIEKYVWFRGTKSSNGEVQLIGALKPNPLGLHDILGNVDEIVLEPFRLNKLARLHGQAGGFVVKGGNFQTSEEDVRSSYRNELAPFDDNGPRRSPIVGFRLALVAPVISTPGRLEAMRKAWAELPKVETLRPGDSAQGDPLGEIQKLIAASADPDVRARLTALQRAYAQRLDDEINMRARASKSLLRLAAFLADKIKVDRAFIGNVEKSRDTQKAAGMNVAALDARLREMNAAMQGNVRYYADTIVQIAQDFADSTIAQQLGTLRLEFDKTKVGHLDRYAQLAARQAAAYRKSGSAQPDAWLKDILALP
jgi:formylglycine-generating enzyme required for sulfatase activity